MSIYDAQAQDTASRTAGCINTRERTDTRTKGQKSATQALIVDMAKLHVRAYAHPLPDHPAALHWQMTAGFYAALAARMLDRLAQVDPVAAGEVTAWCNGSLDADADLQQITAWITANAAGSAEVLESWLFEARAEAVRGRQATADLTAPV